MTYILVERLSTILCSQMEWKNVRGLWSYGVAIRMQGDKWKARTAPFYLGEMNFPCVLGCGAIHFYKE
jgi:hypothetical protein